MRDRSDALGRIIKVHPNDQDEHENPCVHYDVEWPVIGGTLTKIAEYHLKVTSGLEEGLTITRRRETHKPTIFTEDTPERPHSSPKKKKGKGKESKPKPVGTKKAAAPNKTTNVSKKAPQSKKTAPKPSKAAVAKKKPAKPKDAKRKNPEANGAAGKKRKTTTSSTLPEKKPAEEDVGVAPKGMDLYEKQRREFDRVVTRLEKVDQFGWFWDPVPANLEENYEDNEATSSSKVKPIYPAHAPYNWEMIRRRKASGRYVLDRVAREEEEFMKLMQPYYASSGRRPKKMTVNPRVLYPSGVHWELFRQDVLAMIDAANERTEDPSFGGHTSLEMASRKLREALDQVVERTGARHERVLSYYDDRHRFDNVLRKRKNTEAAMQSWRRTPFPERRYEKLRKDVVSAGLSELDERTASYELKTSLPDSFIGMSYRYDDTGQSEAWMKSLLDDAGLSSGGSQAKEAAKALAADKGVVRAQVVATMQSLLIGVHDKVMTETSVLHQPELVSANWIKSEKSMQIDTVEDKAASGAEKGKNITPEIVEQPVWGIDCYTRKNVLTCLEAELDPETSLTFLEKWLLPAINACPPDIASDISNAARILEGLPFQMPSEEERIEKLIEEENPTKPLQEWSNTVLGNALVEKIKSQGPPWLKAAANIMRRARESLGPNFFRVHPKGHGSVLLSPRVDPNRLVTFYRGEIYPAWRWGEKMDAIEITQQRKGLRPMLPDFYNMALERPQSDPRGYGLLFVDASRKGGHGSALSHSCQPTCEVRVAAKNGGLCLAMTTLRELEMGEELTFDYNAATDSLNEYQSAVCLCGHGKCRGSFLHYATADCYQKVMNRNCPIASRFSNLIKGCMKRVMSEDDEKVLKSHGFRTAAFGAISVNRHDVELTDNNLSDTLDIVPVWLKTYAADTLRYIEYERRALPITLICDQMPKAPKKKRSSNKTEETKKKDAKEPTKPEPPFFYFSKQQSAKILEHLKSSGIDKTGVELQALKQQVASKAWGMLTDEQKETWKSEAKKDFDRRKKEWKAVQANARRKAKRKSENAKPDSPAMGDPSSSKMEFQDADAEGISAMEHRVQHLTQALSRVGRVLDRHREKKLQDGQVEDFEDSAIRDVVHSPLKVLSDAEVISCLWTDDDSILKTLSKYIETGKCVSQELRDEFAEIVSCYENLLKESLSSATAQDREVLKRGLLEVRSCIMENLQKMLKLFRRYKSKLSWENPSQSALSKVGAPKEKANESSKNVKKVQAKEPQTGPADANSGHKTSEDCSVNADEVQSPDENEDLADTIPQKATCAEAGNDADDPSYRAEDAVSGDDTVEVRKEISRCLDGIIERIESRDSEDLAENKAIKYDELSSRDQPGEQRKTSKPGKRIEPAEKKMTAQEILEENPWIDHIGERVGLETAADLLLLYATTSNFFAINPYATLESTPIEVYARELGNAVPKTAIDEELLSDSDGTAPKPNPSSAKAKSAAMDETLLCSPDDVVAKVTVQYSGEYVLSQLLQWYNGGIGQKPGLPDLSGCVALPHISGCWRSSLIPTRKITTDRKTPYDVKIRQKLVEWLQDPYKRGDPIPDEVKQAFCDPSAGVLPVDKLLFGSPVLDFLVMGEETNIFEALEELDKENKLTAQGASTSALSTVDRGRPAQAVCRWVQCENPDCLKWRRIPWHVDIDLLPEKFYCKDNQWEPSRMSCDVPEDDWDADDKLVGVDGKVDDSPTRKKSRGPALPSRQEDFRVGAKFDVRRTVKGKDKYSIATVTHIDFSGKVKRVKFHFKNTRSDADEWIEFGSDRISVLHSFTGDPANKTEKSEAKGKGDTQKKSKQSEKDPHPMNASSKGHSSSSPFDPGQAQASIDAKVLLADSVGGFVPVQKIPKKKRKKVKENGEDEGKDGKKAKKRVMSGTAIAGHSTNGADRLKESREPAFVSIAPASAPALDSFTPDTASAPRQVTAEKATPQVAATEEAPKQAPLSSPIHQSMSLAVSVADSTEPDRLSQFVRSYLPSPSSLTPSILQDLHIGGTGVGESLRQHLAGQLNQGPPQTLNNDLGLLAAVSSLPDMNQSNVPSASQPTVDIQSLIRRAGTDPVALLQLHQLFQNHPNSYRT